VDIGDECLNTIFLLRQLRRGEQDPNIEFNVFVSKFLKIGLDEQTIGSHVLEPFPRPQIPAFVAVSFQRDLAVLQRVPGPPAHPKGFTSCSFEMRVHRYKDEKPRLRTDHPVETARLQFHQELLRSIAGEAKIEHSLLAFEQIREDLR